MAMLSLGSWRMRLAEGSRFLGQEPPVDALWHLTEGHWLVGASSHGGF